MAATKTLPTRDRLLALIDQFAGQRVIVFADLVADRFLTGTPKRISREAPVLILRYDGETLTPGGGANAVANVAALGGVPLPLGVVGDDTNGRELIQALRDCGATTEGVLSRGGFRTPTKTRILAGGRHSIKQQIVRYDIEDELTLAADERNALLRKLQEWRGSASVAIVSDYGYGGVEPALLTHIRSAIGQAGTLLCDSRYRLAAYAGLDGATPNEEEAEALLGGPIGEDPAAVARSGRRILDTLRGTFLLITRGSRGMALFADRQLAEIPVHGTDQVADVTGAGDTVIGTFALALAAGATPLEAAMLANYAGGVVVMKAGTATLSREELGEAVRADPRPLQETRWAAY